MIIRKQPELRYSDVTPKQMYLNRRRFLATSAAAAAGTLAGPYSAQAATTKLNAAKTQAPFSVTDKISPTAAIEGYNNFYEFGTDKDDPARNAPKWKVPSPWQVRIEGPGADKPQTLDLDAIMKMAPLEERIYRHRCVEALVDRGAVDRLLVERAAQAGRAQQQGEVRRIPELLRFEGDAIAARSRHRVPVRRRAAPGRSHAPAGDAGGRRVSAKRCPTRTALRCRLVVPWKYGFKSIKSINKISLVEKEPPTTWNISNAREYGFYSNVNPEVDHPRWSQATEERLGQLARTRPRSSTVMASRSRACTPSWTCRKNY